MQFKVPTPLICTWTCFLVKSLHFSIHIPPILEKKICSAALVEYFFKETKHSHPKLSGKLLSFFIFCIYGTSRTYRNTSLHHHPPTSYRINRNPSYPHLTGRNFLEATWASFTDFWYSSNFRSHSWREGSNFFRGLLSENLGVQNPRKLTVRTWKMMVGRPLSFRNGPFWGDIREFSGV